MRCISVPRWRSRRRAPRPRRTSRPQRRRSRLAVIEGRRFDPMLAAYARHLRTSLILAQNPDDLFFVEPMAEREPALEIRTGRQVEFLPDGGHDEPANRERP